MKVSISNIAWPSNNEETYYKILQTSGVEGLEIAPTKIFGTDAYAHLSEAKEWSKKIKTKYSLNISSMQSIWYGRQEAMFTDAEARKKLFAYTQKAIDFAEAISCPNLVFGCPKNRKRAGKNVGEIAKDFFSKLGEYAYQHGTVIAMEANPTIYDTDYINTTDEAFALVKELSSQGFMVNLDFGTIIANKENLNSISENLDLINHIHISEPYLGIIKERKEHIELKNILKQKNYSKYVSIEMKTCENKQTIIDVIQYIKGVFE